jgi:hypothetical protein
MSVEPSSGVVLPAGWTIPTYRETSSTDPAGRVVQGIAFTLQSPTGQPNTVFVPNTLLGAPQAVQAAFTQKIQQITAIVGA